MPTWGVLALATLGNASGLRFSHPQCVIGRRVHFAVAKLQMSRCIIHHDEATWSTSEIMVQLEDDADALATADAGG